MKILFLLPRYHTNIIETIKSHQKLGHTVEMHVKNYGFVEDYTLIKPIIFPESFLTKYLKKIFKINTINNSFYLPKLIKYFFYLKKRRYDYAIMRVHGFFYTYLISIILKLCKVNIIYYQQTNIDLSFLENKFYLFNIRKLDFYLRLKLFNAKWVTPLKNDYYNIPLINIHFLPFVVKIYKQDLDFSNLKILTIGKFVKRKNHFFLIESIMSLIKNHNIKITIIGEVSNNEHQKYFEKLINFVKYNNLERYVLIKKNIQHKKIYDYYSSHNLFVLPSTNEPASISLLEAMGFGLPCICSNTCGTKTYIKEKYNGYIFENNNKQDLKDKINLFVNNSKILEQMSRNSLDYSKQNISFENYKKNFEKIIK